MAKRDILETLDRLLLDEKEVASLRLKANDFWGLGEVVEKHLYAGTWSQTDTAGLGNGGGKE